MTFFILDITHKLPDDLSKPGGDDQSQFSHDFISYVWVLFEEIDESLAIESKEGGSFHCDHGRC